MPSLQVGLLGYGLAGSVFHAPLIQACESLQLAAVGSRGVVVRGWLQPSSSCLRPTLRGSQGRLSNGNQPP
jgi:hypothetical protein